jgi:hypothetical protein
LIMNGRNGEKPTLFYQGHHMANHKNEWQKN